MQQSRQEYRAVSAFCIAAQGKESNTKQDIIMKPQNLFNKIRISSLDERDDVRERRREIHIMDANKFTQEEKNFMSFEMRS